MLVPSDTTCLFESVTAADLAKMRRFIEVTAVALGGDPDVVGDLVVAANEAITNIIRHGYDLARPGDVQISVTQQENDLYVCLQDNAPGFDPTSVPPPDTSQPLSQRRLGGMGVHMMRTFTDKIEYRRLPGGTNELTLIRYNAIVTKS